MSYYSSEAAIPGWIHPAPLRTWKLSSRGPHQYWAGRLPGNVRCCLPFAFLKLATRAACTILFACMVCLSSRLMHVIDNKNMVIVYELLV